MNWLQILAVSEIFKRFFATVTFLGGQLVKCFLSGLIFFTWIVGGAFGQSQGLKSKGKSIPLPKMQVSSESTVPTTHAGDEFVVGKEDVLQVNVWREPELSSTVVVRPDGKITLPLVNEIQASGLTARQLQEQITAKLKDFVASPVVTVMVQQIRSQTVFIMGEVSKAGEYPMGAPMTVLELLGRAGGFREYAKTKRIRIIRDENGRQTQFGFNYNDFIKGKHPEQNIILKNGDVVIVP